MIKEVTKQEWFIEGRTATIRNLPISSRTTN
jgi:hypothetical protein